MPNLLDSPSVLEFIILVRQIKTNHVKHALRKVFRRYLLTIFGIKMFQNLSKIQIYKMDKYPYRDYGS